DAARSLVIRVALDERHRKAGRAGWHVVLPHAHALRSARGLLQHLREREVGSDPRARRYEPREAPDRAVEIAMAAAGPEQGYRHLGLVTAAPEQDLPRCLDECAGTGAVTRGLL